MSAEDDAPSLGIAERLRKHRATGAHFHAVGDVAGAAALHATSRREQRHFQNVNRTARAVGEAAGVTFWLMEIMAKDYAKREVTQEKGAPAMVRMLDAAGDLLEELAFEAHVAVSYTHEEAPRRRKRSK